MGAMASQITGVSIVFSTVFFRGTSTKISKLRATGIYEGNSPVTGEFPAQRASDAEDDSIWWRQHECRNINALDTNWLRYLSRFIAEEFPYPIKSYHKWAPHIMFNKINHALYDTGPAKVLSPERQLSNYVYDGSWRFYIHNFAVRKRVIGYII